MAYTGGMPGTLPPWRLAAAVWLAAFVFALAVTLAQLNAWGFQLSPFVRMTSPLGNHPDFRENPFFGYSLLLDDGGALNRSVFHKENISYLFLSRKLVGGASAISFYDGRVMLSFLTSTISWVTGTVWAAIAVNALLWSAAITAAFLWAYELGGRLLGGAVAAIFCALGTGYWLHALDLSAHTASFATYAVGAYAIFRSSIWRERKGWRTHAMLAAVLAIACSTYNSGIMLVVLYLLASVMGRNRIVLVVGAALAAIAFQYAWPVLLGLLDADASTIADFDRRYLLASLGQWLTSLSQNPVLAVSEAFRLLIEYASAEPVTLLAVMALGIASLPSMLKRGSQHPDLRLIVLLIAAAIIPWLLALPWSLSAGARGYVSYQGYIAVYVALGALGARLWSTTKLARWPGAAVLTAALAAQTGVLVTLSLGGAQVIQDFFMGGYWKPGALKGLFVREPLAAVSLTGGELPHGLGGCVQVGSWLPDNLMYAPDTPPSFQHIVRVLIWRLYFAAPFATLARLWAAAQASGRRWLAPAIALAALVIVPAVLGPIRLGGEKMRMGSFDQTVDASTAHHLKLDLTLSPDAARTLSEVAARKGAIQLGLRRPGPQAATLQLTLNGKPLPVAAANPTQPFDAAPFAAVAAGDVLSLRIDSPAEPLGMMTGYRSSRTPGAHLFIDGVEDTVRHPFLPMLEIRAYPDAQVVWPTAIVF